MWNHKETNHTPSTYWLTALYKKFQKRCGWLALTGVVAICIFSYALLFQSIPDTIRIVAGREESFDLKVPVTGEVLEDGAEVFTNQSPKVDSGRIRLDMNDSFTLHSEKEGTFSIVCKLFGIFDLKEVSVEVVNEEMVVPCGIPVGIYVKTDGILAVGTGAVTGMDGMNYEPAYGLVKSGDYIKTVNDEVVSTKEALIDKVNQYGGNDVILGLMRNGEFTHIRVTPIRTGEKEYKIGVWVRDDMAGVGTMTFYTTDMRYGALGHPISDADTSTVIALGEGRLYETRIVGITRGEKGSPGELAGVIDYQQRYCLGTVAGNSQTGIYGVLNKIPKELSSKHFVEVGLKQEMKTGPAKVVSYVSGQRREYDIEITSLDFNSESANKGIQFRVTDPELLNLTGGIVQGMSGSPILQNGKLVGAVTHVFIQDPAKGYGVFIENMLRH